MRDEFTTNFLLHLQIIHTLKGSVIENRYLWGEKMEFLQIIE